ncbi:uncharacterized protein J7T54_004574 [Emericellopsis cladophorae]|uniref:Uncharacterized protein n=1 Tax=Emericellopsis cladophorae TaxID=2686198 RepID=A0A9P9Y6L3_9HYPO|nr:uncharacterized protein J7T54_004574 [Emericellopsis cladophorae]KAI6784028.1 hypothetical protein J7T54_004574 [Emericellopsis cladophorae]
MQRQPLTLNLDSLPSPRPTTREGDISATISALPQPAAKDKDRKSSFSRKATSFTNAARRRGSSNTTDASSASAPFITDATAPPALPDYALPNAAKLTPRAEIEDPFRSAASPPDPVKMLSRTATGASMPPPPTPIGGGGGFWQGSEGTSAGYKHMQDTIRKRMATMDYLRKAHAGRCYWFNAYLMDKSDLHRAFDQRKLARRATNYLLLGLSLPVLADLYSSSPVEFLRAFTGLLNEFESFQQLRNDSSASAISRARLPTMFRRPGGKSRRSTSAAEEDSSSYPLSSGSLPSAPAPSVMNFAASESDLLPGEEYTYLLTPSLPFEPDYFETFATLCDALSDVYNRILMLVPTTSGCTPVVMEQFAKADTRVRKILVAGVVKEFEESSRANIKAEVASVGKVVLGGLM